MGRVDWSLASLTMGWKVEELDGEQDSPDGMAKGYSVVLFDG